MKLLLSFALIFGFSFARAEDSSSQAEPSATPMTKENTSATAKKRLRHVGKNIEKLGHEAGHKLGIKQGEPTTTNNEEPASPENK